MKSYDIVGYIFCADIYCPDCIIDALPTGDGQAFDGWSLGEGVRMTTEENLTEVAAAFGIDRNDEGSFDSGDFPKVVFAEWVESSDERCGHCHESLIGS